MRLMGVPTSEVGYAPAMPRREDHEVHKRHVVALGGGGTFGTVHEDQRMFRMIVRIIYSAKINGTHCYFSMTTFTFCIMLPTAQICVNSRKVRVVTFVMLTYKRWLLECATVLRHKYTVRFV